MASANPTILSYTVLGNSTLSNGSPNSYTYSGTALTVLPGGDIFAYEYYSNDVAPWDKIEFLQPDIGAITDVTAQLSTGALPTSAGVITNVNPIFVGNNSLPDLFLAATGNDDDVESAAQVQVLVPVDGRYVDEASLLPQISAFNHRISTGEINGDAAAVIDIIGSGDTAAGVERNPGVELLTVNADGTFINLSSHLPTNLQPGAPYQFNGANAIAYTVSAVGDFTGNGGDIFLGGDQNTPSALLENNGQGYFTEHTITAAKPTFADGGGAVTVFALPTKFYGDNHEDLIVAYADAYYGTQYINGVNIPGDYSHPNNYYYLQFLQGDGNGNFTDVTAQHLAVQAPLTSASGEPGWVSQIAVQSINGLNDLILYVAGGAPEILVNNGQDVYTAASLSFPADLTSEVYSTNGNVQGFYGLNSSNQWVFVPTSTVNLTQTGVINDPVANQMFLFGKNTAGATTVAQTFETAISITLHGGYGASANDTFNLLLNGHSIGSGTIAQVYGFTYQNNQYTTDQTFTFTVKGLGSINSLQLTENSGALLNLSSASIGGTSLTSINGWIYGNAPTDTLDASPWNSSLANDLGASTDPIRATGTGTGVSAFVLGNHTQYTETGLGTSTIHLSESAGLDQNAVLTDVAYVVFQDGSVLNTQTGVWSSTTASATAGQASAEPSYVSTINVSDSAANISSDIDTLESLASASTLGKITLTDSGTPTLSITAAELAADAPVLDAISGSYMLTVAAGTSAVSITGLAGHAMTVAFSGDASDYSIGTSNGAVTVSSGGVTDKLSNDAAIQFADVTELVADAPGTGGAVTTGNVTELYSAVLAREPDLPGLSFYQTFLQNNPATSLLTFAEFFLNSAEYKSNPEHTYAQSAAGDTQFISDSYQNLLHRTPSTSEVSFYESNVLAPAVANLTPGTAAYAAAQFQAHAQMLVYFSVSPEFLSDVQATATNPASAQHWLVLI